MNINRVNNANFCAGNVYLKSVNADKIRSYGAIKNLAQAKDVDILIIKNDKSVYLPTKDLYLVVATTEKAWHTKGNQKGTDLFVGSTYTKLDKNTDSKELSVKIFNSTMNAIDVLEKKLGIVK